MSRAAETLHGFMVPFQGLFRVYTNGGIDWKCEAHNPIPCFNKNIQTIACFEYWNSVQVSILRNDCIYKMFVEATENLEAKVTISKENYFKNNEIIISWNSLSSLKWYMSSKMIPANIFSINRGPKYFSRDKSRIHNVIHLMM